MKYTSKLASVFCAAALAVTTLTGCEGSDIFSVNGPDWLTERVDSIANANQGQGAKISPTTLGNTDCSSAWWDAHLDQDIKMRATRFILPPSPTIRRLPTTITTMLSCCASRTRLSIAVFVRTTTAGATAMLHVPIATPLLTTGQVGLHR